MCVCLFVLCDKNWMFRFWNAEDKNVFCLIEKVLNDIQNDDKLKQRKPRTLIIKHS